ncbi:hypothetical protein GJ744_010250 [Endocarpon pusillum]|uniref:Uncharacterized protein n=1 Tax=Endocarpon pusillum TaxID=364733 RepID=A0A8H7AIM8_9EURO|nr:hypothetical protein GJ744_010250 [Endocarpon pusillum]
MLQVYLVDEIVEIVIVFDEYFIPRTSQGLQHLTDEKPACGGDEERFVVGDLDRGGHDGCRQPILLPNEKVKSRLYAQRSIRSSGSFYTALPIVCGPLSVKLLLLTKRGWLSHLSLKRPPSLNLLLLLMPLSPTHLLWKRPPYPNRVLSIMRLLLSHLWSKSSLTSERDTS